MELLKGLWKNRWLILVAGLFLQSCGGLGYVFSLYSQVFKNKLGYGQKLLDTLATFKDIGGAMGLISGVVYNIFPTWVCILIGALETTFGYGMLWLVASEKIPEPPFWLMAFYICFGTNGQPFFNTAVLVTGVQMFPNSRGIVVGLVKGYIGLSGAIFTRIYIALYAPDQESFLFLVAWLPALVALLVLPIIRTVPLPSVASAQEDWLSFAFIYALGIGLSVYLTVVIVVEDIARVESKAASIAIAVVMLLILGLHILVPIRSQLTLDDNLAAEGGQAVYSPVSSSDVDQGPLAANDKQRLLIIKVPDVEKDSSPRPPAVQGTDIVSPSDFVKHRKLSHGMGSDDSISSRISGTKKWPLDGSRQLKHGDNYTLLQALCTVDFWLLFIAMVCGTGSGLTAINNMAQMGAALSYPAQSVSTFVSLLSIWNFLGRLGGGYMSEVLVHAGIPRPIGMVVTQGLMVVANLLFAVAVPGSFYISSIVIGMCYGAQWALMPSTASEIFGLQHFGLIYNVFSCSAPLGSYLLSACVAGYLYDAEVEKDMKAQLHEQSIPPTPVSDSEAARLCLGAHCFRLTFYIVALFCVLGSCLSGILAYRTRNYYVLGMRHIRRGSRAPSNVEETLPAVGSLLIKAKTVQLTAMPVEH